MGRGRRTADGGAGTPGGSRLRALREQAGRTQLWVEAEADLGSGYLQRVEYGRVAQPGRATVERILTAPGSRYSERREVLELFGYTVAAPLPAEKETAWAIEACRRELHAVDFPAYVLDCAHRLVAWNRYIPHLFGPGEDAAPERLAGQSLIEPWFQPASPLARLVAEPDRFLPALVRALVPVRLAVPGAGVLQFRLMSERFTRDARFRLNYYIPADSGTMRCCAAWSTVTDDSATTTPAGASVLE